MNFFYQQLYYSSSCFSKTNTALKVKKFSILAEQLNQKVILKKERKKEKKEGKGKWKEEGLRVLHLVLSLNKHILRVFANIYQVIIYHCTQHPPQTHNTSAIITYIQHRIHYLNTYSTA
jgi:hypothetical protein